MILYKLCAFVGVYWWYSHSTQK